MFRRGRGAKRKQRRHGPRLSDTIVRLAETEDAFRGVDPQRVREVCEEFYLRESGKCGEFLVSRETLTESQLDIALAEQAKACGNHAGAIEFAQKARAALYQQGLQTVKLTGLVMAALNGRSGNG